MKYLTTVRVREDIQNILNEEEDREADIEIELGLSDNLRELREFAMDDMQTIPGIGDNSVTLQNLKIGKTQYNMEEITLGKRYRQLIASTKR